MSMLPIPSAPMDCGSLGRQVRSAVLAHAAVCHTDGGTRAQDHGNTDMERALTLMLDELQELRAHQFDILPTCCLGSHKCPTVPKFADLGNCRKGTDLSA